MEYSEFFRNVTGYNPYPYQKRFSCKDWPSLMVIPTGLGKTASVIVSWLYCVSSINEKTPRRLVYCLPMRVLVEQTRDCAIQWVERASGEFRRAGMSEPAVHVLMGGEDFGDFDRFPERPAILIGTQDMLLSRALNRGYGMSRFRWPTDFGLLNNDCLWVIDEVQLMGTGLATTVQLHAFRDRLGVMKETRTLWMSATASVDWFRTVDFDPSKEFERIFLLDKDDERHKAVTARRNARKSLSKSACFMDQHADIAKEVLHAHVAGERTLVVVNTVDRACRLFDAIRKNKPEARLVLIHSRFRLADRKLAVDEMLAVPDASGTIVVSTQVIEAGVDVSARVLFSELAPWPSLVQRFGRCNRAGEFREAKVFWIDTPEKADKFVPPYDSDELSASRSVLSGLKDVGAASLPEIRMAIKQGHVLRKKDLVELFDTTQDLTGHDVDVSRFIRDVSDHDVQVFWRDIGEDRPSVEESWPDRMELCSVPVGDIRSLLEGKDTCLRAWVWNFLTGEWEQLKRPDAVYPGLTILLNARDGRYDEKRGWAPKSGKRVEVLATGPKQKAEKYDSDQEGSAGWEDISMHTEDVVRVLTRICDEVDIEDSLRRMLLDAALRHDAGKGHPAFQAKIKPDLLAESPVFPVAKAPKNAWRKDALPVRPCETDRRRKYFRHELVSGLLSVAHGKPDLVSYLAAAHHGKVRLSIRSFPDESRPPDGRRFARGVWDGDVVPELLLGFGDVMDETSIDLRLMELGGGDGSGGGSWSERMLALRDDPCLGPFRIAFLETLLKAADERASGGEE